MFALKKLEKRTKIRKYSIDKRSKLKIGYIEKRTSGLTATSETRVKHLLLTGARQVGKTYAGGWYAGRHSDISGHQGHATGSDRTTYLTAQELHAHGWYLYYFQNKKQGELDFVLEHDAEIIPLEVKSGKDYDRHVALNNVMKNPEYGIRRAVVLCNDNVKVRGAVVYMPIYMLMFIEKVKDEGPKIYKLDLEGLVGNIYKAGYRDTQRILTPKQVAIIYDYIGTPEELQAAA